MESEMLKLGQVFRTVQLYKLSDLEFFDSDRRKTWTVLQGNKKFIAYQIIGRGRNQLGLPGLL
jgi:hypothetical protein